MSEIIIGCLLVFVFLQDFFNRKERQKLTEAFLAKHLKDIEDLEITRKFKPTPTKKEEPITLMGDLDDAAFDKYIKQVNEAKEENA